MKGALSKQEYRGFTVLDIDFNGAYAEAALSLYGLEVIRRDGPLEVPNQRQPGPLPARSLRAMNPAHPKARLALETLPDCCQHTLKPHKNKLSIGLPVGKIDSVHQSVAAISSDRGAYHVLVIGSNSWMGI